MFETIKENRWVFFVEGIILTILGIVAVSVPQLITLSLGIFIGVLLIMVGIISVFKSFTFKEEKGLYWPAVFTGMLGIFAGLLMFKYVGAGIYILTTLLVLYLGFEGITKIIASIILKPLKYSNILMLSGIFTLILAILVISGLPGAATWFLGLIFGVNLMVSGLSYIAIGLGLQQMTTTAH